MSPAAPEPASSPGGAGDRSPSGEQFEITWKEQRATVVEVGGGVREYCAGERAVLDPYPIDAMCDGAHGAPLIPWPNRLADGRYRFDGVDYQVALTEPEKSNAIHGLLRWRPWKARRREPARVVMAATIFPLQGFPFMLDVEVEYRLGEGGLEVRTAATNLGSTPCPFGAGQHPYLSAGGGQLDGCRLELRAGTRIVTDPERQLPVGEEPVQGTAFDFRQGRVLGDLQVDFPFTDLERDQDGRAWAVLTGNDGHVRSLWVDRAYSIIEVYTGDTLSRSRRRLGLGSEPMTCPPNALQTGQQVVRLEPGQSFACRWGARLS
ncbi:MAG: aldose 1-epimerase family protein [Candidatus Dormibacteria bacterium]